MAHATHYHRYSKNTQLSPGRTRVALTQVYELALARRLPELAAICKEGIAHAERLIDLRARRKAQATARGGGDAQAVDRALDRVVRALARRLEDLADSFAGEPIGDRAAALVQAYFPEGHGAVTTLPYEDELGAVSRIHAAFTRGDAVDAVGPLELGMLVGRMGELLPKYAEALALRAIVTTGDLRSGQELMHVSACAAVAYVLWRLRKPEEEADRAALLAPFDDQYTRAAEARRRRAGAAPIGDGEDGAADELDDSVLDDEELALDEAVAGDDGGEVAPIG